MEKRLMRFCGKAYSLDDVRRIGAMGLHAVEFNLFEGGHKIPDVDDLKREAKAWELEYLVHGPNEGKPTEIDRLGTVFFDQILALLDHCTAYRRQNPDGPFLDGRPLHPRIHPDSKEGDPEPHGRRRRKTRSDGLH